jgi:hypothetical protein
MAGQHRVIRNVARHPFARGDGEMLVCFFCGASVADTEGHVRYYAERDGVEIDLEAGAVRLEEFDAPDRWQLAERADADREVARTRGERWRERRDQRRRQALADELAGLKRRATEIKEEMSAIG